MPRRLPVLPAHALEAVVAGAVALQVSAAAVAASGPAVAVAAFVKMVVPPRPEVAASRPTAFVRPAVPPQGAPAGAAGGAVAPSMGAVGGGDMPIAAAAIV